MNTHNICFHNEIKYHYFQLKKCFNGEIISLLFWSHLKVLLLSFHEMLGVLFCIRLFQNQFIDVLEIYV